MRDIATAEMSIFFMCPPVGAPSTAHTLWAPAHDRCLNEPTAANPLNRVWEYADQQAR